MGWKEEDYDGLGLAKTCELKVYQSLHAINPSMVPISWSSSLTDLLRLVGSGAMGS